MLNRPVQRANHGTNVVKDRGWQSQKKESWVCFHRAERVKTLGVPHPPTGEARDDFLRPGQERDMAWALGMQGPCQAAARWIRFWQDDSIIQSFLDRAGGRHESVTPLNPSCSVAWWSTLRFRTVVHDCQLPTSLAAPPLCSAPNSAGQKPADTGSGNVGKHQGQ